MNGLIIGQDPQSTTVCIPLVNHRGDKSSLHVRVEGEPLPADANILMHFKHLTIMRCNCSSRRRSKIPEREIRIGGVLAAAIRAADGYHAAVALGVKTPTIAK